MQLPLSILVYQRVIAEPDPLFPERVDRRRLEQHLRLLTRWFRVLPLSVAVRQLRARTLPGRAVCITFDNGYAETVDVALPLLQRHAISATFFVASRFLDGGRLWSDTVIDTIRQAPAGRLNLGRYGFGVYDVSCPMRRRVVIDMLIETLNRLPTAERAERIAAMARAGGTRMLCPDQLLALHRAGMDIGAHTAGHSALSMMSNADACTDIAAGRNRLEDLLQRPVSLFAYQNEGPGRDVEQHHVNMLRSQGFDAAVTSVRGAARADTDPFALPRFAPRNHSSGRFLFHMGTTLLTAPA